MRTRGKRHRALYINKLFTLWLVALSCGKAFSQTVASDSTSRKQNTASTEETKAAYQKILRQKDNITSSVSINYISPLFIKEANRNGAWTNVTYQNQWFEMGYNFGKFTGVSDSDKINAGEFQIGTYLPLKRLAVGRRLYDIKGMLLVPGVSAAYTHFTAGNFNTGGIKLSPGLSLQIPFVALDIKMNAHYRFKESAFTNQLSFYPEVGLRIDGLYNLLDPGRVYVGHAEGTQISRSTSYRTTYQREGDFVVTTTYRTETTTITPYSFDRYIKSIGPFTAIGPRYSFSTGNYAGKTSTIGLGYYLRTGILSSDLFIDYGKIGFASSDLEPRTIYAPEPKVSKFNKNDTRMTGTYSSARIQGRIGVDLIELYASAYGVEADRTQVKFTRIIGGAGLGYASISAPEYDSPNGLQIADSIFNNDYTLLTNSRNHAKFGSNSPFISLYLSLEAGSIMVNFEKNFYPNAFLANVNTITVAYLFPYNRMKKKYMALRSYKKYLKQH